MANPFCTVSELNGNTDKPRDTPKEKTVTVKDVSAHCAECAKEVMLVNVLTSH